MKQDNALQVYYDEKLVGTLAMPTNRKAAFQYTDEWLEHGFSISPFSLPLKKQVFVPTKDYFGGLYGVFADSLPDNWGRLLLNRLLREHKQDPDKLTVLDRLAIVGKSGMGALTYYPERKFPEQQDNPDLDELARECQKILNTEYTDKLDELYRLGGTSGGARPKIMTSIGNEEWIIKFPVIIMLPAFFALVRPDSSMQKPACIKNTSAAPTSTHTVLTAEKSITISSLNSIFFVMSSGQVDPSLSGLLNYTKKDV